MKRGSPELDSYCRYCGEYKGVGICVRKECSENNYESSILRDERLREIQVTDTISKVRCVICDEISEVECINCRRGFCKNHTVNYQSTILHGLDHHIGTCDVCQENVCEHCWIVKEGKIQCRSHLED